MGRRWHKEIERELHAAKAVVVLWSATSRDSDFVLEEAEYGKRKDILFPAFIERVECPYGFGRIQTADLIGWDHRTEHAGLAQLLESLRVHLNGSTTGSPIIAEPAKSAPTAQTIFTLGDTFRDKFRGCSRLA
ncbi:toll/interleukin-1 receptor domain-containing protein [Nitrosomonas sp. Is35]|uniref:toll/interleukin-1 receptor domain-containing protein n=1 Tax=Nitrosomonas sp. Is35 TaxID=3080534 RepID=UPI00294B6B94|nr:toll/interleukin-1 receptor domain-containing protein [Nitrosomonas sp. Is35]MDV6348287.1 toll/interleukin-1 receptor domain-containing protein [Nitrosomonas sp. Is35]